MSANVIRTGGMLVFISGKSRKNLASLSRQFAASADRSFQLQKRSQLFNFANFAIEHGGALGRRAGRATTQRCATRRRCAMRLAARAKIPAKVVVCKVQSNLNNGAANRLEVVEDTTDEALCGPKPVL